MLSDLWLFLICWPPHGWVVAIWSNKRQIYVIGLNHETSKIETQRPLLVYLLLQSVLKTSFPLFSIYKKVCSVLAIVSKCTYLDLKVIFHPFEMCSKMASHLSTILQLLLWNVKTNGICMMVDEYFTIFEYPVVWIR